MTTRRNVTQEYKDDAVRLVLDSGRSIAEVARSISVHEMTLGKWVKKVKDNGRDHEKELSSSECEELERLREESPRLRMEAEFAKKVADLKNRVIHNMLALAALALLVWSSIQLDQSLFG